MHPRQTSALPVFAVVGALGLLAAIAAAGVYAYQWTDAARRLPGARADLDLVEEERITSFVPPEAALESSHEVLATETLFAGAPPDSGITRRFDTKDEEATMRAFIEPAIDDGWRLVEVSCRRRLDSSEMVFTKRVRRPGGGSAILALRVANDRIIDGAVVVSTTAPREWVPPRDEPRPVEELLDTGVARTDPGCLQ
jgi:hypothetical protein